MSKLGWSVDARTHGIAVIVERLLAQNWEGGVPEPIEESDCVVSVSLYESSCVCLTSYPALQDCYAWEFGNFRNSSLQTCNGSQDKQQHGLVVQADAY